MKASHPRLTTHWSLLLLSILPARVLSTEILKTDSFSKCLENSAIQINRMDIEYNHDTNKIIFDAAGVSEKVQNVTASLSVLAYGTEVYQNDFNPCDANTFVDQLCPVPAGEFAATGEQDIPESYADMIPAIAFTVPDLEGTARMELNSLDTGEELACIQSTVENGKTAALPAVEYVAAGVCASALMLSGLSALASGGNAGTATSSPTFGEVVGWLQSIAMNGMLSVQYPSVYSSFSRNFAFSTGLVQWETLQRSIDSFRGSTGGDLSTSSVDTLKNQNLVHSSSSDIKRDLDVLALYIRNTLETSVNGTNDAEDSSTSDETQTSYVDGIQEYVEELTIPQANTFITVLLVFAIVVASIALGILLFKVILETWALFGTFPPKLTSFRKRYWWLLAKTITNLILILYGIWTMYCVYQFTKGDSWAAKTLAGVTFVIFTAVLGFFTFRIWRIAQQHKKEEGDVSALFEDKETWRKYSFFYENYKKSYWWIFAPAIVYMLVKGCIIAGGDGHGLFQASGQLIVEAILLILLLWSRPYTLKSGNIINIIIQVVRVLSVICILVFVEQLGINQTTKTITGLVLIVMQSVLTGLLALLIAVNVIVVFCKANPHRKKRKEAEKLNRDLETLTPLDARNSLLMDPTDYNRKSYSHSHSSSWSQKYGYESVPPADASDTSHSRSDSRETNKRLLSHDRQINPHQ